MIAVKEESDKAESDGAAVKAEEAEEAEEAVDEEV